MHDSCLDADKNDFVDDKRDGVSEQHDLSSTDDRDYSAVAKILALNIRAL